MRHPTKLSTDISEAEHEQLRGLCEKYAFLFSEDKSRRPSRANVPPHVIDVQNARPIRIFSRQLNTDKRKVVEQEVRKMSEAGLIRPSQSSWSSPVCLARKKDGSWRFCCNYQKLNDVTRKDAYTLPSTDICLSRLSGSHFFSSLDMLSGFWAIPLEEESKKYTAFATPLGSYEWNVLPFGLTNSPATFQRAMDIALSGVEFSEHTLTYCDDTLIFSKGSFQEHLVHLESVFVRLAQTGFTINAKKCALARKSLTFLGHVVNEQGALPIPEKVAAIAALGYPQTKPQLRTFIALCNYYRRFVPNFAHMTKGLNELIKPHVKWAPLSDERRAEIDALKHKLCTSPVLAHPNFDKPWIMATDASDSSISCVLSQLDEQGFEHPISYFSKGLNESEKRWKIQDREAFAVVWGASKCRPYILGHPVRIFTDNAAVNSVLRSADVGKHAHWRIQLMWRFTLILTAENDVMT